MHHIGNFPMAQRFNLGYRAPLNIFLQFPF